MENVIMLIMSNNLKEIIFGESCDNKNDEF